MLYCFLGEGCVWWGFGKVRVIIHLYLQGFLQGVDNGCDIIVKVLLVWGVKGSDGNSAGGRRYIYVPLYLRIVTLSSSKRFT